MQICVGVYNRCRAVVWESPYLAYVNSQNKSPHKCSINKICKPETNVGNLSLVWINMNVKLCNSKDLILLHVHDNLLSFCFLNYCFFYFWDYSTITSYPHYLFSLQTQSYITFLVLFQINDLFSFIVFQVCICMHIYS